MQPRLHTNQCRLKGVVLPNRALGELMSLSAPQALCASHLLERFHCGKPGLMTGSCAMRDRLKPVARRRPTSLPKISVWLGTTAWQQDRSIRSRHPMRMRHASICASGSKPRRCENNNCCCCSRTPVDCSCLLCRANRNSDRLRHRLLTSRYGAGDMTVPASNAESSASRHGDESLK